MTSTNNITNNYITITERPHSEIASFTKKGYRVSAEVAKIVAEQLTALSEDTDLTKHSVYQAQDILRAATTVCLSYGVHSQQAEDIYELLWFGIDHLGGIAPQDISLSTEDGHQHLASMLVLLLRSHSFRDLVQETTEAQDPLDSFAAKDIESSLLNLYLRCVHCHNDVSMADIAKHDLHDLLLFAAAMRTNQEIILSLEAAMVNAVDRSTAYCWHAIGEALNLPLLQEASLRKFHSLDLA